MKLSNLKILLNKLRPHFLIILILIVSLFLRIYNLEQRTGFDADQEEIAFRAKELLTGNPVLLGPKTSVGMFSIGPGFTYLWAFLSFFLRGAPISGAYLSVLLGVLTVCLFYLSGKKLFNEKIGLLLASIYAFSSIFIFWDQNPWAPSLFYLAEILMIVGAYLSTKNKNGILLVSLGFLLGFQSHIAVFLVLMGVFIYWIFYSPVVVKRNLFISISLFILSISPLVLFDLTHRFENIVRLLGVFGSSVAGHGASPLKIINSWAVSNISIFYPYLNPILIWLVFIMFSSFMIWKFIHEPKDRQLLSLFFILSLTPIILFIFYQSNFSEYYLVSTIPPFVFILGYIFDKIPKKYSFLLFLLIVVFIIFNLKVLISYKRVISLSDKKQAVEIILEDGGNTGYGISLSTELGYGFGFKYLFDYYDMKVDVPPLKDQKKTYTIAVPNCWEGVCGEYNFNGVGVIW